MALRSGKDLREVRENIVSLGKTIQANGLVAQAVAKALQTDIMIFEKPDKKWKMTARLQCEDGVLRDPIVLLLHNEHYRTITSPKDIPKSWKSATPKQVVSRGAGKSVKSFSSWLKPASVIHARQSSNQKNTSCSSKSQRSWLKPGKIFKASSSKATSQATDGMPSASSHKQSDQTIGEHSSIPERGSPSLRQNSALQPQDKKVKLPDSMDSPERNCLTFLSNFVNEVG